ncbi:Clavaminate synthase-like protein [Phialemonium atrogriseum]|uniref:Clavaminate synthase-like protein n=1 Tax=Phialemonium atrogriseum TaxID=1093897 RepID=A0AAJ0FKS3_9PEZI|nr:Clavaminate synthase-like protein [Phialemonium atrogriseum]KAK1771372.1 Clavaminate synthase-like protein [Phialemonium atrogriseum]
MPGSPRALTARCVAAVEQIDAECRNAHDTVQNGQPSSGLAGCGDPLVQLLQRQASSILELCRDGRLTLAESGRTGDEAPETGLLQQGLDDLLSKSYSKFYDHLSKDLPPWLRQLYTDASILKFSFLFLSSTLKACLTGGHSSLTADRRGRLEDELSELVKILDLAIILAGAAGQVRGRRWIDETFSLLEDVSAQIIGSPEDPAAAWPNSPSFSKHEPFTPPVKNPIRRTGAISMESFQAYLDRPADPARGPEPLVIPGLADDWPATTTRPWAKPGYLLSRTLGGRRLVPVEVGRSYVDEAWAQKLVTVRDFLRDHIGPSSAGASTTTTTAYLAQHALLAQLPALRADITVPDLCYTAPPQPQSHAAGEAVPELDEPLLNAWFGPPGTITPLHTDPYHNLLVQVVGRKYVRLYGPRETPRMRARGREGGVDMGNTSLWDVGVEEGWDPGEGGEGGGGGGGKAEFGEIPFVDCILEPGDTVYIPVGWWHYVRGLSVSFSVSFWWN